MDQLYKELKIKGIADINLLAIPFYNVFLIGYMF